MDGWCRKEDSSGRELGIKERKIMEKDSKIGAENKMGRLKGRKKRMETVSAGGGREDMKILNKERLWGHKQRLSTTASLCRTPSFSLCHKHTEFC